MKILITESANYSIEALSTLSKLGEVDKIDCDRNKLLEIIGNYNIIVIRLNLVIDKKILDNADILKFIVSPTTGLNHIDTEFTAKKGIEIISLKGERNFLNNITGTAELAWGLLLSLTRNISKASTDVSNGRWDRDKFIGNELSGKTLGIIGLGRLGSILAEYGQAFRMRVVASDPSPHQVLEKVEMLDLKELLKCSDIISIHIEHNSSNNKFFNQSLFDLIKPGAMLINTSRGEIIDEFALIEVLKSGKLAGAALDVLTDEFKNEGNWLQSNPLWQYAQENPNLLISPHIGGATMESMEKTEIFIADKLKESLLSHSTK